MNDKLKPIIFLDVDGVLNCSETKDRVGYYVGIDDRLVSHLADLAHEFDADIVLVTTWKRYWHREDSLKPEQDDFANRLDEKLAKFGLKAIDKAVERYGESRGDAILRYLKEHPAPHYVILDDEDFDYSLHLELFLHWAHTDFYHGGFHAKALSLAKSILSKA